MLATQDSLDPTSEASLPYVELSFGVVGKTLPADHGYGLYSGTVRLCSRVHDLQGISIQTITGFPDKQGIIYLSEHSKLRIRLPVDQIPMVYPLAGKSLKIGRHDIRLGIPKVFMLNPTSRLRARIVVIKGFQEPEPFLEAANRQLQALGITGSLRIPNSADGEVDRKVIKIKRYSVVGFGLEISDLSDEDSLKLQVLGLGGKRKMGCGIFIAAGGS